MRLTLDAIPRSTYWVNLRTADPQLWEIVRRQAYTRADHLCTVCGAAEGILHAHEIWQYALESQVQWLFAVKALCPMCHACQHLVHTDLRIAEGTLGQEAVIRHFCTVNGCGEAAYWQARDETLGRFHFYSAIMWQVSAVVWLAQEGWGQDEIGRVQSAILRRLADPPVGVTLPEY